MPHIVLDLLASWKGRVANKVMMKFGMLYLYVICGPFGECLTNNRAFEGSEWSTTDLKMILLWVLFDWMAVCYHAILFLLYLILLITVFVLDVVFPSTHLVYWVAFDFFNKFTYKKMCLWLVESYILFILMLPQLLLDVFFHFIK